MAFRPLADAISLGRRVGGNSRGEVNSRRAAEGGFEEAPLLRVVFAATVRNFARIFWDMADLPPCLAPAGFCGSNGIWRACGQRIRRKLVNVSGSDSPQGLLPNRSACVTKATLEARFVPPYMCISAKLFRG